MWKLLVFNVVILSAVTVTLCGESPVNFLGGGNFPNGEADDVMQAQYDALYLVGATQFKITLDQAHYYNEDTNGVVLALDQALIQSYENGMMTPLVLFEYDSQSGNPVGDYTKWFSIGRAYAERYSANSEWAKENNISNFGISVFSAFDEPTSCISFSDYYFAILGLADGVHSVQSSLSVIPGGFSYANTNKDYTLNGFGPLLAPLWNNGTLDGIDLHTFYDIVTAPIEGTYTSSAQSNFDMVKKTCNITRDINFYSTKWNFRRSNEALVTEEYAAKEFLTAYWDIAGVVKNDGKSGATKSSFVWNLFDTNSSDLAYGMCSSLTPTWTPLARGTVLRTVQALAYDCAFSLQDPKGEGIYKLVNADDSRMLVVWQNRPFWSSLAGTQFTLEVPPGDSLVDVYGWDGLRQTIQIPEGATNYTFEDLPEEETLMFLIYPTSSLGENDNSPQNPCSFPSSSSSLSDSLSSSESPSSPPTSSLGSEENGGNFTDPKITSAAGKSAFSPFILFDLGFLAALYFVLYL